MREGLIASTTLAQGGIGCMAYDYAWSGAEGMCDHVGSGGDLLISLHSCIALKCVKEAVRAVFSTPSYLT